MLTQASIHHFKSISLANLALRKKNVIVGANGSGKSNVLDALYFLHDCASDGIDSAITKRHGIDSLRQWSKTRPYNITLEIRMDNVVGSGGYKVSLSSVKGNFRIIEETGNWFGPHPRERYISNRQVNRQYATFSRQADGSVVYLAPFSDLKSDRAVHVETDELFLTALARRISIPPNLIFKPIADELISFSKYNIYPNTLRNPQLVSREVSLAEDGSNLASVLKRINSNKRFSPNKENILAALRQVLPMISDFQIRSAAGYYVPVLRVVENSGDIHDFNLSQISDGTLRTLGLLTAFYQPSAPSKIGVEEPEQMIHPGALQVIAEAIGEFTDERQGTDRGQVFLTTHSPNFLDSFSSEDIIWTRFVKGVTECGGVSRRQTELIKKQLFSPGEILLSEGFF